MQRILVCTAALIPIAIAAFATAPDMQVTSVRIETLPLLRTTQEMKIGSASDPNVGLINIVYMDVDRDGQVILFEARDRHIRVYSATGQLVRTIGRPGQGPGEFANFAYTGVKGDTIWAVVPRPNCGAHINLYRRTGELISTAYTEGVRRALNVGIGVVMPRMMTSEGHIMGLQHCVAASNPTLYPPAGPSDTVRFPRLLFNGKGEIIDTVGWDSRLPRPPRPPSATISIEGRRFPESEALPDSAMKEFLTDGTFIVDRRRPERAGESSIRITRLRLNGDTAWSRTLGYTPTRYSDALLDSIALARATSLATTRPFAAGTQWAADQIRAVMKFPDFHVPVFQTLIGDDGALWLRTAPNGSAMTQWILIAPDGKPRGRVDLPPKARLMWSQGNTLWISQPDEDDVVWLLRLRLRT